LEPVTFSRQSIVVDWRPFRASASAAAGEWFEGRAARAGHVTLGHLESPVFAQVFA
jgi:hypothetical protein